MERNRVEKYKSKTFNFHRCFRKKSFFDLNNYTSFLKKYDEENVLNLNENQICCLVDFIIEEMCLLYQRSQLQTDKNKDTLNNLENNKNNYFNKEDQTLIDEIKFKLVKRIHFLKHFLKKSNFNNNKLLSKIILQLQHQKQQ